MSLAIGIRPIGITPACAGIRFEVNGVTLHEWDHPRMRGDKEVINGIVLWLLGSPPHARG